MKRLMVACVLGAALCVGGAASAEDGKALADRCEHSRGNPQASIAACNALLGGLKDATPRSRAILITWRGMAYVQAGAMDQAKAEFDQAIAVDPTYAPAQYERGKLELNARRAIAYFDKAAALEPDSPEVFLMRGLTYDALHENEKAMADYDRSIALRRDPVALDMRGDLDLRIGRAEQALSDFEAAKGLDAGFADPWIGVCRAQAALGRRDLALAACEKGMAMAAGHPHAEGRARLARGHLELLLGRLDAALADLDWVVRADEWNAHALYGRSLARRAKGDVSGADADLAAARKLGGDGARKAWEAWEG